MTKETFLRRLGDFKTWEHISSKRLYSVIGLADQNAKPEWGSINRVVYMDSSGNLWTRPLEEFVIKFKPFNLE